MIVVLDLEHATDGTPVVPAHVNGEFTNNFGAAELLLASVLEALKIGDALAVLPLAFAKLELFLLLAQLVSLELGAVVLGVADSAGAGRVRSAQRPLQGLRRRRLEDGTGLLRRLAVRSGLHTSEARLLGRSRAVVLYEGCGTKECAFGGHNESGVRV